MRLKGVCIAGVVLGGALAAAAGPPPIEPFTQEAVARGLSYTLPSNPTGGYLGFGCGFADLDGDGDADVVILGAADGHVGIFENDGTGFFIDRSATSGIPNLPQASALAAADYDGDGLVDLYLTQVGLANVLCRNDGAFSFTDVTAIAGVGDEGSGKGACFGDFDGDNRLDLYVCNYTGLVPNDSDNLLYRNLGNGTFEEIAADLGVDDRGRGFQAVWSDYDGDGDPDLYLSNDKGTEGPPFHPNQLWRNDAGSLVNVSGPSGADVALDSMGLACGDFDGNGWPDFYCTNIPGEGGMNNPLLLNQGDGTFCEESVATGVDNPWVSWGAIFFDFDNNGHTDLYVNNMTDPNTLYVSTGTMPLIEMAAAAGVTASGGTSFSAAVGDVDGDGDLDLLVNNLGNNVELFINHEGDNRSWIRYRMVGHGDNVLAVGGTIKTRTARQWQYREILAGGNGYLGQNELAVTVGLDTAGLADEVIAAWPGGAATRTLTDLPAGETWTLYPPERLGDADADGSVELDDFLVFDACYDGGFQPGCEMMDFDGNSVINLDDFNSFIAAYDGPLYDCNDNTTFDLQDILLDASVDLDGTGIPDSCEAGGDLDGDGSVGIVDFLIVLGAWGPCPDPPAACPADIDDDGMVGITDFLFILGNWG